MKEFHKPISKERLDIIEKTRSNLFSWRGQFSPQLVEVILDAYCFPNSVILDPFVGVELFYWKRGFLNLKHTVLKLIQQPVFLARFMSLLVIQKKGSCQNNGSSPSCVGKCIVIIQKQEVQYVDKLG